jgi:23S rRNA (adenine-N6)-dimethyltransferase
MVRKRIRLAQNFLKDQDLARYLVKNSSISAGDVVLEIGPGEGTITDELAKVARKVIAVEKDPILANKLSNRMRKNPRVQVHKADFIHFRTEESAYKIFSNIPFNMTAEILREILNSKNVSEAYLILQKEAAEKYSGMPTETEISVLYKPWFIFDVLHEFGRTDFEPAPSVNVVLFRLQRRDQPLVQDEAELYRRFVGYGFHSTKENLSLAFKKVFTYTQWKRLAADLKFPIKVKPTQLAFQQWLGLFNYLLNSVAEEKKTLIRAYQYIGTGSSAF